MRRTRRRFGRPVAALLLLSLTSTVVVAQGDQMGFTTYYFSDSGSNSVITTAFNLAKTVWEKTIFLIDIELDNVTVPPVTAVTGATRPQRKRNEPFEKNRGQVIVGLEQGIGQNSSLAASFYRSQEIDYTSTAGVATLRQELNNKNTTVTLRGQYTSDHVGKITDTGDVVTRKKQIANAALGISQILSTSAVLDLNYDFVRVTGFQSDPYRQVRVFDASGTFSQTDELHPSERIRHAAAARLSQMIPAVEAAIIMYYRYYFDSWKVRSHTGEVKLNKYIFKDLILGVDYRFYTQTAADFYQDKYIGAEFLNGGLRTADYKLRPFSSNNFGFSLSYLLRGLVKYDPTLEFLERSTIEVMYFRYFNDLEFSADIIQVSLKFSI